MAELEGVRLQSVVRSLRTTDCKRRPCNSAMCAFAPPEKMARLNVEQFLLVNINQIMRAPYGGVFVEALIQAKL